MKVYYILLSLFALVSPLFSMEKAPYTPASSKRPHELIVDQLDSHQDQSSPKTPRLFDEIETEPLTPFLNVLAPTPLNSQMEQEAPQSIVQAQISTEVPAILQTFFNTIDICRICSADIGKNKLLAHCNLQHQGQKPFKCPTCNNYESLQWKETSAHIIDKHMKQYDPQECWACSCKINKKKYLIDHFNEKHPGLQPYKCPQCPYTSRDTYNTKMHIASHFHEKIKTTSAQKNITQLISLPSSPTVLNLLAEPPTPQTPNLDLNSFNSYPCFYEKCGQTFSTKQEWIEHLNSEH